MAAPTVLTLTCTAYQVAVKFNQTLFAPTGRPGEGFTCTVNGVARLFNTATQATGTLSNDTVALVPASALSFGDTILVSYSNATANLQNGTAEAPVNFTASAATNSSVHAGLLSSVLAAQVTDQNVITLSFTLPVTSADYSVGATIKANGVTVAVTSSTQGSNVRQVKLTLAQALLYSDTVTISYSGAGSWTSGMAIAAFTDLPVINASRLGTSLSQYPLSTVVGDMLFASQGLVTATISVDLNMIDLEIVRRYGPVLIDFGGTYGVTSSNPAGLAVVGPSVVLSDGVKITETFGLPGFPSWSADAGRDWIVQAVAKVQAALTKLRGYDVATNLGTRTIRAI